MFKRILCVAGVFRATEEPLHSWRILAGEHRNYSRELVECALGSLKKMIFVEWGNLFRGEGMVRFMLDSADSNTFVSLLSRESDV